MNTVDVLIPTYRRPAALAVTLTSLTAQTLPRFRVVVSDQTDLLARLLRVMREQGCGFVGAPLVGLSHLDDVRPHEQHIEPWDRLVEPEDIGPGDAAWERHNLHNAANAWHVQQRLGASDAFPVVYKVAWVGGCVLYDVAKLRAVGGFSFWRELPVQHCGEDVLAQLRVMQRYGGCGVLPSGAYHQQLPTTVEDRGCDAPTVLRDGQEDGLNRFTDRPAG